MQLKKHILILIILQFFLICGCATPTYRQVFREKESFNSKEFSVSKETLYHASVNAMCAGNFIIENEDIEKGFVLGKRSFQRGNKTIILLVQGKIVGESEKKSRLFVNAIETTEVSYVSDRTRFFLFIIPLPGGGGKEAHCIKQREKTVQDRAFYKNFLKAVEHEIPKLVDSKNIAQITAALDSVLTNSTK